jgi:alpha-beta hydrolase superfamily lysophospholipase
MAQHDHPDSVAGRIVTTAAVAIGVITAATAIAGTVATVVFARTVVTPPKRRVEDVRILAVEGETVTLSATRDSLTPGRYSLWFARDSGHARVGEILSYTATTVTRQLIQVDFGELVAGARGRFSGWYYLDPRELGYPTEDVQIETDLGPAPAWLVPAAEPTDRWVIAVHGRAVRRQEAIRGIPVFREQGYTSLVISYRNDTDAPSTPDNRYALGDTEWLDVEAAMRFAVAHGAREFVLMGWSMGGATVLQALSRSDLAPLVRGVVLESPVVDWVRALQFQSALNRVPPILGRAARELLSRRWAGVVTGQSQPIDLARLNFVARADELAIPVLILHSDDDGFIPADASRALAEARPDIVTFEEFTTARHTKLWNYDSQRWTAAIAAWLIRLG